MPHVSMVAEEVAIADTVELIGLDDDRRPPLGPRQVAERPVQFDNIAAVHASLRMRLSSAG